MDLYNWQAILEASTLYDSAIAKQNYLKESLEKGKINYSNKIDKIEPYLFDENSQIIINGKALKLNFENRKPKTHKEVFENEYNEFITKITAQINALDWDVMNENELLKCELETTLQGKYFCFSKLKTYYTGLLNENELFLREANPKAYKEHKKEYTEQLEKIENRLLELKAQNSKPQNTTQKTVHYSLQCDYSRIKIENDLYPLFVKVFECTKEQIINLLSENITTQVTTKNGFTLKDVVYFVNWLYDKAHIKAIQYGNVIDKTKCIIWNGKPITSTQIKKTKDTFKNSLPSIEISNILK